MRKIWLMLFLFLLPLSSLGETVLFNANPPEDWSPRLRITLLNTGRSDAILVESAGETMLVDGGGLSTAGKVADALSARGITQPKYFLSTHPHDDHIEGLTALMERGLCPVRFLSAWAKDDKVNGYHTAAVNTAWKNGVIFRLIRNGDTFSLGDAQFRILRADASGVNGKSAAAMFTLGQRRILLAADLSGDAQKALLSSERADALAADLIKAPHHGENAMVEGFLTAVSPQGILCTTHEGDAPALARQAKARNLPIFYTGNGAIILETDGEIWVIRQESIP